MEVITETKKGKEVVSSESANHTETEIRVPDLSYFDEDDTAVLSEDNIFVKAIEDIRVPEPGHIYDARFVGEDDTHFLLDSGFKDLVRVSKSREESFFLNQLDKGDLIRAAVIGITDSKDFSIDGSVEIIFREEAFEALSQMGDEHFVSVKVNELTNAGYNCTISINGCEIESFLPQILAGVNRIHDDDKDQLVGEELEMCIESYVEDKGTWIVSRRKYLNSLIPSYIDDLETDIEYDGIVTGTAKFGVFVEFNECLTGMIHRSNLSEDLVDNFGDIKQGDEISFKVKEVLKGNRIILTQIDSVSLWDTIDVGQNIEGTIKDHKPFGTLIVLDHETLGLIHVSEQTAHIKSMKSGEKVDVTVLATNRSERKIYLRGV